MSKWALPPQPEVELSRDLVLTMTARSIAVDRDAPPDETGHGFDTCDAIVGELSAEDAARTSDGGLNMDAVRWYRGQLLAYDEGRTPYTVEDVAASLVAVVDGTASSSSDATQASPPSARPQVFFRAGETTFRLFAVKQCASPNAAEPQDAGSSSESAPSPHRRAKDRYTSAVAFEFVTDVISNVLGDNLYPAA